MKSAAIVVWLVAALLVSACSGSDEAAESASPGDATDAVPLASAGASDSPGVNTTGGLPIVVFGLRTGEALSVLGEPTGDEIGMIPSGSANVFFTGDAANGSDNELLWRVEHEGVIGWVPPRFGYPANRENVTGEVQQALGAMSAAQDNGIDTALVVSGLFSFTSPPSGIMVSHVARGLPSEGNVVIDVVDEAASGVPGVLGYRLEVVTERSAQDKFEIVEVWRTAMCQNGTQNGECT